MFFGVYLFNINKHHKWISYFCYNLVQAIITKTIIVVIIITIIIIIVTAV